MHLLKFIKAFDLTTVIFDQLPLYSVNAWKHESIAWSESLGQFVIVASGPNPAAALDIQNLLITSQNGSSWTNRTLNGRGWKSVTWIPNLNGQGLFCAVGEGFFLSLPFPPFTTYDFRTPRIAISTNGINWTYPTDPTSFPSPWSCVAGSNTRIVALRNDTVGITSTSGSSWSTISVPTGNWKHLIWASNAGSNNQGLFCAVGESGGASRIMTSADGLSWSVHSIPNIGTVNRVVWSTTQRKFCAVGANGIVVSNDTGTSWTSNSTGIEFRAVAFSPDLNIFIAMRGRTGAGSGGKTQQLYYSYNANTWSIQAVDMVNNGIGGVDKIYEHLWHDMVYAPALKKFVIMATQGPEYDTLQPPAFNTQRVLNTNPY